MSHIDDAVEDAAIEARVAAIMRDPEPEAIEWISGCYNHHYQTLVEIILAARNARSAESCRMKLSGAIAMIEAQLSVYVGQAEFGGVRT